MKAPNSIGNVLSNEDDIRTGKSKNVAGKTADKYITMLRSAFIFYSVGRYDVKGKQLLKILEKNYIVDMGLHNMLLGYRDADRGLVWLCRYGIITTKFNSASGSAYCLAADCRV